MEITKYDYVVIFGATGDLVERKVIPSLYHLFVSKQISIANFKVFAFARRDFTNGKYNEFIDSSLQKHFKNTDFEVEEDFYSIFEYVQGNLDDKDCFVNLNKKILNLEAELNICANKLFYLAIPPSLYDEVIMHIKDTQFNQMCKGAEVKVLIEKPFGLDLGSSEVTDNIIKDVFKEEQIFRLDHYLGKSILRNIPLVKEKLKDIWNTQNIERVFISTTETLGVENRGEFFDSIGSLRDVGQNHLLEIIALIAMENVSSEKINEFRAARANILNKLIKYSNDDAGRSTFRAQYKGYKEIDNVKENSQTETYFKVAAYIDTPEWKYTKFVIEAGKRTGQSRSFVEIDFKNKDKLFINFSRENPFIRLFKGANYEELMTSEKSDSQYVEEYAVMLKEALSGDLTYFIDHKEVKAQWEFIDPIVKSWKENAVPLFTYMPDDISILSVSKI